MAEYLLPTENLPVFNLEVFKETNDGFLTYAKAKKYFLTYPTAQGTETFNILSANSIIAPGDLALNPIGSINMTNKTLNITNGQIQNCPLIHSQNNNDIVVEGKGTGTIIFKANNLLPVTVNSSGLLINTNYNINMSAGTGTIQQARILGDVTSTNTLKKTNFAYNSNSVSGAFTGLLEFIDSVNNKGCIITPNVASNVLGNNTVSGDTTFMTRLENNGSLCFTNWQTPSQNMKNNIRVFTTDLNNCGIVLQNGNSTSNLYSEFRMTYNKIDDIELISLNNPLDFNPKNNGEINPIRRQITGLGTLSFTDLNNNVIGGTSTSRIFMDSTATIITGSVPGTFYDCNLNNGSHNFITYDNTGTRVIPVFFGSSITSILNTFSVRNATTTSNRFDISTDGSQNTTIRARSTTASTNAKIIINCDSVSTLGVVTNNNILNINTSVVESKRPIQLTYGSIVPSNDTQLGNVNNVPAIGAISTSASASVQNYTDFDITTTGTYLIQLSISLLGSAAHTLTDCRFSMSDANNTLAAWPGTYGQSLISSINKVLSTTITQYFNIVMPITISATTKIYINYILNWTGGGTVTLNAIRTLTRIG